MKIHSREPYKIDLVIVACLYNTLFKTDWIDSTRFLFIESHMIVMILSALLLLNIVSAKTQLQSKAFTGFTEKQYSDVMPHSGSPPEVT